MNQTITFVIAIKLPPYIQRRLSQLCVGLPHVYWEEEEQLHLLVRSLGAVEGSQLIDITQALENIRHDPFIISLRGVHYSASGQNRGKLWTEAPHDSSLRQLKQKIDQALLPLGIPLEKKNTVPYVALAEWQRTSTPRLTDYLANFAFFESQPFEVDSFSVLSYQITSKRKIVSSQADYRLKS